MQEQELKAQWRASSKDEASESIKEAHDLPERRWSRGLEVIGREASYCLGWR